MVSIVYFLDYLMFDRKYLIFVRCMYDSAPILADFSIKY